MVGWRIFVLSDRRGLTIQSTSQRKRQIWVTAFAEIPPVKYAYDVHTNETHKNRVDDARQNFDKEASARSHNSGNNSSVEAYRFKTKLKATIVGEDEWESQFGVKLLKKNIDGQPYMMLPSMFDSSVMQRTFIFDYNPWAKARSVSLSYVWGAERNAFTTTPDASL